MKTLLLLLLVAGCVQDYAVNAKPVDVDPGEITECGFTRVEETDFYSYDCNPVFTEKNVRNTAFHVTQVLDHPFYQMWYTEQNSNGFDFGYAVSPDGTAWESHPDNPLLTEPDEEDWDYSAMDGMQVVWDPNESEYVNLYQGYNLESDQPWGLGVATSPDGVQWKRIAANPVYELQVEDDSDIESWCWPLGLSLGEVAGYTGYVAGSTRAGHCEVYRINGKDTDTWTPDPDMVFAAGEEGEWDDEGFTSLSVQRLGEPIMFYVGFGDWEVNGRIKSAYNAFLGTAHINDDGKWERDGDPVPLHQNTGEYGTVSAVAANVVDSRIHLWVTDQWCLKDDKPVAEGENCSVKSAVGYFLYDPEKAAAEEGE